jgi:translation elongation factor EF-1alpha
MYHDLTEVFPDNDSRQERICQGDIRRGNVCSDTNDPAKEAGSFNVRVIAANHLVRLLLDTSSS